MALDLTALTAFNNETAGIVIPKMVYEGTTAEYTSVQEGIKYKEPINLMETNLYLQDGFTCPSPSGALEMSQRDIEVCALTSVDGLCLNKLNKFWAGPATLGNGSYNETWALATEYVNQIVNQGRKAAELAMWNGSAVCSTTGLASAVTTSGTKAVSAAFVGSLAQLDALVQGLPSDVAGRDDLTIFTSVADFYKVIAALRTGNSYFFDPSAVTNRGGLFEINYPFMPGVKIVGTPGVANGVAYAGPAKEAVVGFDSTTDFAGLQLWYDINTDQLRHRLSFKVGANIAYPANWVYASA
jgi:hypothetical protein